MAATELLGDRVPGGEVVYGPRKFERRQPDTLAKVIPE